jgi:hypothetical protein
LLHLLWFYEGEKRRKNNPHPTQRNSIHVKNTTTTDVIDGEATLPANLAQALLVQEGTPAGLQTRIEELTQEQQHQKREFKNIRQTQVRLAREKKAKSEEIAELQRKCDELQRLKFGGAINLEAMEAHGTNDVRTTKKHTHTTSLLTTFVIAGGGFQEGAAGQAICRQPQRARGLGPQDYRAQGFFLVFSLVQSTHQQCILRTGGAAGCHQGEYRAAAKLGRADRHEPQA